MLAVLVFRSGGIAHASVPAEAGTSVAAGALEHFNPPAHFQVLISDRELIDAYQRAHHRVETSQRPEADPFMTVRHRNPRYVRTVVPQYTSSVLAYWQALPESFVPLRNYYAPILTRANDLMDPAFPPPGLTKEHDAAAELIVRGLAQDGLLPTLARVIELLGPEEFLANSIEGTSLLRQVGFPTDFLGCFRDSTDPAATVLWVAQRLRDGAKSEDLRTELAATPFRFVPSAPGFQVAVESGEAELGLLRMQANGGYRDGTVPGGSIDVICQAVAALPNADSIISMPRDQLEAIEHMARNWRLRRTNHVTLIGQPFPPGAWAQDNGKAGVIADNEGRLKLATITPRFASQGEGKSNFRKAESFSMEGLRAAGHEVVHSRLLFQGGNLLPVRDPKTGERILLISEGDIYRNFALGLAPEQIQEAFRAEFGVDRCATLPAASYHLDFDVTIRATTNGLVAFVNDTHTAAREIVRIGIDALKRGGVLSGRGAADMEASLAGRRDHEVVKGLWEILEKTRGKDGAFTDPVAKYFAVDQIDSAGENLQTFLVALDVLESALPDTDARVVTQERQAYMKALRRMKEREQAQTERLGDLGWTVVAMPSMTDLFRSINYLNGIHYHGAYMMPVFGGLYVSLDKLAAARFQTAVGSDVRIQPIRSADCQRHHGSVHCAVAAYPKI